MEDKSMSVEEAANIADILADKDCLHIKQCYHADLVPNTAKALRKVLRMGGLSNAFFTQKRTLHRMNNFKDALNHVHPLNRATARKLWLGVK